jgi:hypothetical protein
LTMPSESEISASTSSARVVDSVNAVSVVW